MTVIGIAGHAKSGKTTIARALAEQTGWPVASFGDEVSAIARERGLALADPIERRTTLMTLGEALVAEEVEAFCRRVLAQGGWAPGRSVIIEGIRHAAVVRALAHLTSPAPFRLVLVETSSAVRDERLREAGEGGSLTRATMDAHSTEREVSADLAVLADVIVNGEDAADQAVATVLSIIASDRSAT